MNLSAVWQGFGDVLVEVLIAITPLLLLFILFHFFFRQPGRQLLTTLKGFMLAYLGLALFLQGVKVGFLPAGTAIGSALGALPNRWILIPIGFILGFVATLAEPAVRILSSQVEKASSGYIREKLILYTLCLGVAVFVAVGMFRIVYGISFYYLVIPGYILALVMLKFSDPTFIAIAFDSGGVATGPMTVTFIMAMAVGVAGAIEGRDTVLDGFGLVALVALAPILLVMTLGFIFRAKEDKDDEPGAKQ